MNPSSPQYLVCERSGHWAAALRVSIHRLPPINQHAAKITETRSLKELESRLAEVPDGIVLIEISRNSLSNALDWLSKATQLDTTRHFVAAIDEPSFLPIYPLPENISTPALRSSLASVLLETGVVVIVWSPRQLTPVIEFATKLAAKGADTASSLPPEEKNLAEWAENLLPWQAARRPVG